MLKMLVGVRPLAHDSMQLQIAIILKHRSLYINVIIKKDTALMKHQLLVLINPLGMNACGL